MLNPFIHDSRHTRQDIENIFSFFKVYNFGYLPTLGLQWGFFLFVLACFVWVFLMLRTHPFVPIACLGSQDECFSCIFNEAEVNMGMFV